MALGARSLSRALSLLRRPYASLIRQQRQREQTRRWFLAVWRESGGSSPFADGSDNSATTEQPQTRSTLAHAAHAHRPARAHRPATRTRTTAELGITTSQHGSQAYGEASDGVRMRTEQLLRYFLARAVQVITSVPALIAVMVILLANSFFQGLESHHFRGFERRQNVPSHSVSRKAIRRAPQGKSAYVTAYSIRCADLASLGVKPECSGRTFF